MNTTPPLSRGDRLTDAAATLGTILVSLCSFLLSLHALTRLAGESGIDGSLRYAVSFSIDGLQLTASMLILSRTRLGQGTALPWLVLIASTGLSSLGNVAAAPANSIAQTMYGLGPVTLAVSFHLLMLQIRSRLDRRAAAMDQVQEVQSQQVREVQVQEVQVRRESREVQAAPVNQVHPEVHEVQVREPKVQAKVPAPRSTNLHLVQDGDGTDLKSIAYAALDRLAAEGVTVTEADWRTVLEAEPRLSGYSRPDRQIPNRIRNWLAAQEKVAA